MFLASLSPQVATFIVFLGFFFTFAVSLDNHLPLKFMKESQIVPECCSCSNSPSLLEANVLPCLLQFKCPTACHKAGLRDPALAVLPAHPLVPLALPTGEQLKSCCPSWDELGWEGDSSARLHIPKYHFLCMETCQDHYKCFLLACGE